MDFTILADAKFGWTFIVAEITLLYLLFLVLHRLVDHHRKK